MNTFSGDQARIGDAERELAQSTLNDHYVAGRLDHDEYVERLDRIWAARTRAELGPVFADLPAAPIRTASPYSTPASRGPSQVPRSRWPAVPTPVLVLVVVLGAITVFTHLPIILVGLGVWFFFFRDRGCTPSRRNDAHR